MNKIHWILILSVICSTLTAQEPYIDELFFDDFDGSEVNTSVWQIATWAEHGGQTGVDRCYVQDGLLHLVLINDSGEGILSAAIQTRDEFLYGRWESRLKVSDVPGILNSMYTIDWNNTADGSSNSNGTKEEIDIEFLTYVLAPSYGMVHYAAHATGHTSFQTNPDIPLDFNPSDDFHVWGFDITPEYIDFFVDTTTLLHYVYSEHDVAVTSPYQLKYNTWTQDHWINGPPVSDVECVYQIDWVRFTPYTLNNQTEISTASHIKSELYPNPFCSNTSISYELPEASFVTITLYHSNGQHVQTLCNSYQNSGKHNATVNGSSLPAGLYYCQLEACGSVLTKKCVVIR